MTVGMLTGMLGIGVLLASVDPVKHWPNILVIFLSKLFAPIGFLWAVTNGVFPLSAGWIIIVNDLIWLFPLFLILWGIAQSYAGRPFSRDKPFSLQEALGFYKTNQGNDLLSISKDKKVALVFLRHFGCTFTRQILRELQALKKKSDQENTQIVLVHMLHRGEEHEYLKDDNVLRVSDPFCELYRAFGLGKGGFWELFGPTVWLKGIIALVKGCGVGHLAGDGLQMPGAFLIQDGKIIKEQKSKNVADLPDLSSLF